MLNKKNTSTYNRKWLIKELSERCGFILEDANVFLIGFEDILMNIAREHNSITISNLFRMYTTTVESHKHWIPGKNEYIIRPESYTISFRPSKQLRDIANEISEIKE